MIDDFEFRLPRLRAQNMARRLSPIVCARYSRYDFMNMKYSPKITLLAALTATLLLTASACGDREPSYEDRETFAKETYAAVGDTAVTFRDGIERTAYPAETPSGEWLSGCSDSDRDDQFDAYTLRHESAADGNTTFTYLIYYPHGGTALRAVPELLEGKSGYVLNVSYTAGGGLDGYSLCRLSVTLPTDQAPRLRLLVDDGPLGVLSTVTTDEIPAAE